MRFLVAIVLFFMALPAFAQDRASDATPDEERSFLVGFLEDTLSTPNRQIRISGIQGVLSSQASISEITIADREGVWLRISNATIDWSRSALILRQRLEVQRLTAETINVLRKPLPEEGLPSPEASSFKLPELPVAVNLAELDVPSVLFGETVFGLQSEVSVEGALKLEGGSLDTTFAIDRLDGPGGHLQLEAQFARETEQLALNLSFNEPEDGVVANLLNIEGRPPLALTLAGSGPLGQLDLALTLDANGARALDGIARFRRREEGLGFSLQAAGPISRLVPAQFRGFFGAETTLSADGVAREAGGILLNALQLESASMALEAAAETSVDGFLTALSVDARIADPQQERVLLPVAGGETSLQSTQLKIAFGEAGSERWSGTLELDGLQTRDFNAGRTMLTVGGLAQNLGQPENRRITYDLDGQVSDITAKRADVAEALGESLALKARGNWRAGQAATIEDASLSGKALALTIAGMVRDYAFSGDIGLKAKSLAPFSELAGQELAGAIDLKASGEIRPISGAFDLTLDGSATDMRLENEIAGNLLAGRTAISGGLARGEMGLAANKLRIANEQVTLEADGIFATGAADFDFDVSLADLALLSERASGALAAKGRAQGAEGRINVTTLANVPNGEIAGKSLRDASLAFDGQLEGRALTGTVLGDAFIAGERAALQTGLVLDGKRRQFPDFAFQAGGATATGSLSQRADGLFEGALKIDAPDISTAAALALTQASGSVDADIVLTPSNGRQKAEIDATLRDLRIEDTRIAAGRVNASIDDLFGVPAINGALQANDVLAGTIAISSLQADAETRDQITRFSTEARLSHGADIAVRGTLSKAENNGFRVGLDQATLDYATISARLVTHASLVVMGQNFFLEPIALNIAGGRVTVSGDVAETLDLSVAMDDVPLSIANAIRPDLALGGTLNGTATISGTREKPQIAFNAQGRGIAAAALREAGLSTIALDAQGTTAGERLTLDANITSPEGLAASAKGGVPLGKGALALDIGLAAFPLSILNAIVPDQNLAGQVTGNARITGALTDPQADFDLRSSGLNARALSDLGIGPLGLSANGRYAGNAVALSSLRVSGPSGLAVEASGNVPLSGNTMAINVVGSAPLAIADRFLADRGAQLTGTLALNARLSGNPRSPVINGSVTTAGAQAIDPISNLRLNDIRLAASIEGDRVVITDGSAALGAGGRVNLSGNISTNAAAGFPADLRIQLDEARYSDGDLVTATMSGSLALAGALTRDPLLSGELTVSRAEIVVPENLAGGADALSVRHIAPPPGVQRTLKRARADDGTPMPSARPSVVRLDINVQAPARIFVRGRGLDAELGGSVRLTGPVTNIRPVGGFDLIRGRLSILAQRITFDEGRVTLVGDLDPLLNFVARSQGNDITVFITVRGRVSDLQIGFSSQPQLPEDEVLARLIFKRGIDELSALQIAQLAAAAAELAGGSNTSLLGSLRSATGLDDLDIVTDSEGNAAVRAGRYIQENIYLGVEAGAKGTTRGTINLDITDDLKARGALGSDGDSSVGIFFEKDY